MNLTRGYTLQTFNYILIHFDLELRDFFRPQTLS